MKTKEKPNRLYKTVLKITVVVPLEEMVSEEEYTVIKSLEPYMDMDLDAHFQRTFVLAIDLKSKVPLAPEERVTEMVNLSLEHTRKQVPHGKVTQWVVTELNTYTGEGEDPYAKTA
jgi:hypothetical protein